MCGIVIFSLLPINFAEVDEHCCGVAIQLVFEVNNVCVKIQLDGILIGSSCPLHFAEGFHCFELSHAVFPLLGFIQQFHSQLLCRQQLFIVKTFVYSVEFFVSGLCR